ncbi:MAG TPA: DUF4623 domain-containing protein [Verrucomicrobiae bacterium]|nr:DUF4623 domain-containing protein [Verrucomicrobiae bacterium]
MIPNKTALKALCMALTALPVFAQSWTLTPLWDLQPGSRTYLPAAPGDSAQRGMDYNPISNHLLVASRTGGTFVHILNADTGADLGTLNTTGITGGTFAISQIRVADDGAIYAANLTTDANTSPLKIYRWAHEEAVPVLVYQGDPSNNDPALNTAGAQINRRFGDNFDVRGAGTGTELVVGSRNGTVGAVLTTTDGINFSATKVTTDAPVGAMGLAVTFGDGNTIFGDASGTATRLIGYDLAAGTGTLQTTYTIPNAVSLIDFDPANDLLAGISLNTGADTLALYDVSSGSAVLQDTKTFPADVANSNGAGSVDFGNGRVYALDANNGVLAFTVTQVPEPSTYALVGLGAAALAFARRRR